MRYLNIWFSIGDWETISTQTQKRHWIPNVQYPLYHQTSNLNRILVGSNYIFILD